MFAPKRTGNSLRPSIRKVVKFPWCVSWWQIESWFPAYVVSKHTPNKTSKQHSTTFSASQQLPHKYWERHDTIFVKWPDETIYSKSLSDQFAQFCGCKKRRPYSQDACNPYTPVGFGLRSLVLCEVPTPSCRSHCKHCVVSSHTTPSKRFSDFWKRLMFSGVALPCFCTFSEFWYT